MKTNLSLTFIFLFFYCQINGQETDSLFYYFDKGDYGKAISIGEKEIDQFKQNKLANTDDYTNRLNDLSIVYLKIGKFDLAENILKEAIEIEMRKNIKSNGLALSQLQLGRCYLKMGNYSLAESSYLKTVETLNSVSKPDKYLLIDCYTEIAGLYQDLNELQKSEIFFKKAIETVKFFFGENDIEYIASVGYLAGFYQMTENYQKSQELYYDLYKKVKQNQVKGDTDENFKILLSNLGAVNESLGNYMEAEKLYLETINLYKEKNNIRYSRVLGNLGLLYLKLTRLPEAKSLFEQETEINKSVTGEYSLEYAQALSDLAAYYNFSKEYLKAIEINSKVLEIRKKLLGENHIKYSITLNSLADSYKFMGDYNKSEECYLRSLNIDKNVLGENSFAYNSCLNNLVELYLFQDKYLEASKFIEIGFNPFKNKILSYIDFLSTNELSKIVNKYSVFKIHPLVFLHKQPNKFPEVNIGCYERGILLKNIQLRNQMRISKIIQKSNDSVFQNNYKKFIRNKKQIAKINEIPFDKRPKNYEQIIVETEKLEKELVVKSAKFSDSKNVFSVSWKQTQGNLKPDEIIIDLLAFNYYNKKWTDTIFYGAFIIGKNFKFPKYISLFEEKQLLKLLRNNENKDLEVINKQFTGKEISDLFLKPLASELEGIKTIYLSPYKLCHQINFSALPLSETQTLGEKYKLHILSSPAELADYKVTSLDKKSNLELLLYGGIDYNKSNPKTEIDKEIVEHTNDISTLRTQSGISGFDYLNGTNNEINQIQLKGNLNGFTTTVYKESEATEESIKQLDGRTTPYVLHLATHGFFFPDPKQGLPTDIFSEQGKAKIYKTSDDPMMRSGLLFAGANNYWGKPNENDTAEDGILTASEISNLDLSSCQLVVMSACETGLGAINGSEGVFGLQRAFKMAGVKNIIMSLWKVPDAQTAELFDIFYSECFSGKNIHEAFQSAQSKMKAKYSPYYWAGFVLLE